LRREKHPSGKKRKEWRIYKEKGEGRRELSLPLVSPGSGTVLSFKWKKTGRARRRRRQGVPEKEIHSTNSTTKKNRIIGVRPRRGRGEKDIGLKPYAPEGKGGGEPRRVAEGVASGITLQENTSKGRGGFPRGEKGQVCEKKIWRNLKIKIDPGKIQSGALGTQSPFLT